MLAVGPVAWAVTDVEVRLSLRESFMFFLWIQLLCYPSRARTLIWREHRPHINQTVFGDGS